MLLQADEVPGGEVERGHEQRIKDDRDRAWIAPPIGIVGPSQESAVDEREEEEAVDPEIPVQLGRRRNRDSETLSRRTEEI